MEQNWKNYKVYMRLYLININEQKLNRKQEQLLKLKKCLTKN